MTAGGTPSGDEIRWVGPAERKRILGRVLKGVSRSFYLTVRVLPAGMREPIGLAYLLARAADTIADTRALPPEIRLARLLTLRQQVRGPADFQTLEAIKREALEGPVTPEERALMEALPAAFTILDDLDAVEAERVRWVAATLTEGMEADLTTFPPEDSGRVSALGSAFDLDRYTYLVAGCVGEYWTKTIMAHEPRLDHWRPGEMAALGVRFGKALQLTNVLRDVPRDLRAGRCYLPSDELTAAGLAPRDLLDPTAGPAARTVMVPWARTALDHFSAAEEYLLSVPPQCTRLRLALLWPIGLGLATLALVAGNRHWLDPSRPSRVKRRWVYGMMARSWPAVKFDSPLRRWLGGLRRKVETALETALM